MAPPRRRHQRQFPLADWIDDHPDVPYPLGASGMRYALRTTAAHFAAPPRSDPDDALLRATIARRLGVSEERVLLTHGASEGNALVLLHLGRRLATELGRAPTFHAPRPEYPPLPDVASLAGFRDVSLPAADLFVRSNPHNPTGEALDRARLEERFGGAMRWLIDETFREFTEARSLATIDRPGVWVTGTLTKAFGADAVRLGWVVPPPEDLDAFRAFHGLVTDEVPLPSLSYALDLLADADGILDESRGIFERNRSILLERLPKVGRLSAPVAFDRPGVPDTGPIEAACLSEGILVCGGRFFGDPTGIRIGLTRPAFPTAFERYLAVRTRFAP